MRFVVVQRWSEARGIGSAGTVHGIVIVTSSDVVINACITAAHDALDIVCVESVGHRL